MPSGSFSAQAIVQQSVFIDTFTRTNASSWGSDYTVSYLESGGVLSVDGSVGRINSGRYYADLDLAEDKGIKSGSVQFDFWVPADTTDTGPYYAASAFGTYVDDWFPGAALQVFQQSGSSWEVFLFSFSDITSPYYNFTPTASTWYRVKAAWFSYRHGISGLKVWKVSDPEPSAWMATGLMADMEPGGAGTGGAYVSIESALVETGGFDNFIISSFGPQPNPSTFGTIAANAIRRTTWSGSFAANAIVAPLRFVADAVIFGNRSKHNRQFDHYGTLASTSVVLADDIGQYAAGTDLQTVLESLAARLAAIEDGTLHTRSFTADAWFQYHLLANAVLKKVPTGSFTVDAFRNRGASITADSYLFGRYNRTFTGNGYLVDSAEGTWTWATATPNPADGTSTVYTIPPYKQGTVQAYIDGVAQTPGVDYTETDDTIGTITFTTPPPFGSIVTVHFIACG